MTVENQKIVADKALKMLYPVSPFAIVAGGAPVDWHLGKEARDIDIFINAEQSLSTTKFMDVLKSVGFESVNQIDHEEAENINYTRNPHIKHVYNCKLDGTNIQIVRLKCSTFRIVDTFAFNVNKAWYEHGKITLEKSCKYGLDNKVIVKEGELYASTLRYQSKIQRKFEGFKFFNSSQEFLENQLYKE